MNSPALLFIFTFVVLSIVLSISYRKEGKIKDPNGKLLESVQIVVGLVFGYSLILYGLNNELTMGLSEEYIRYMIAIAGAGIIIIVCQQFYKDYIERKDTP